MSSVWSRPLVEALAERRGQAASCHAGLRCHALSSDWVTVQIEKVTVSRQHGCHSHLLRLQKRTHTHTHTPYNPWRKVEVIWNLCVLAVSFRGVFYLCHVVTSEWNYCWVYQFIGKAEESMFMTPKRYSESICPVISPFISATPLKCWPRVWSCQCCSFPGNRSHTLQVRHQLTWRSTPCSDIK